MKLRVATLVVSLLVLGLFFGTAAQAQMKVTAAYGSTSLQTAPMWIAKEAGFFKKHGLDVELVTLTGPRITAGLLSNSIQFMAAGGSSPLLANLSGADTIIVGTVIEKLTYDVVVKPNVNSFADLKGKVGIVQQRADLTGTGMHILLALHGLDSNKDVHIIQGGSDAERVAAMIAGSAEFTVITPDFRTQYEKAGYKKLVNAMEIPGTEWVNTAIFTTRSFAKANPAAVTAYIKGFGDAMAFMRTNRAESIQMIAKVTGRDAAQIEPHYDMYTAMMKTNPVFDQSVVTATVKGLSLVNEAMKADTDPKLFYDSSFVEALVKEGYFKK
jgi:NitT/TauT family transport system substrate-binding protein